MTSARALALALSAGLLAASSLASASTGSRSPGDASPATPAPDIFLPRAVITESFDSFTGTSPNQCVAGWTCLNQSTPVGTTGWFEGISGVFPAQARVRRPRTSPPTSKTPPAPTRSATG